MSPPGDEGGASGSPGPAPVTLLVLGNPLLGDDGLAARALEALEARFALPPALAVVEGGTGGLDLLPAVEDARRLLVVDAIEAGRAPGALVELEGEAIPAHLGAALSPHQVGLSQVLALARIRGRLPERVRALGLQPGRLREGLGLSPAVEAALPLLVETLAARLREWEVALGPRPANEPPRDQAAEAEGARLRTRRFQ